MQDYSHVAPGGLPHEGQLLRLIDVNDELRLLKVGTPEHRQLKDEQVSLINLLTRDAYGLRELSRAVGKYETWANTTLRDWYKARNRVRGEDSDVR